MAVTRGERDILPGLFKPFFRSFMVFGVGSLQTTLSIMLQRFSTGLISGDWRPACLLLKNWPVSFAPCLGGLGCVCWRPVLDERLVSSRTEHFSFVYCFFHILTAKEEIEASLLSLICC